MRADLSSKNYVYTFAFQSNLPHSNCRGYWGWTANHSKSQLSGIKCVMFEQQAKPPAKKRKICTTFTDQQRPNIEKYSAENGNATCLHKHRSEIADLGESTVRSFKDVTNTNLNHINIMPHNLKLALKCMDKSHKFLDRINTSPTVSSLYYYKTIQNEWLLHSILCCATRSSWT